MPKGKTTARKKKGNGAKLGFEEKLWQAADKLRGHMDAAEYKHVVLGLVFLKYISDAFRELYSTFHLGEVHSCRTICLPHKSFTVPHIPAICCMIT